ncbi:MAG: GxxExxY protein [Phycisphaerales bacterium JB063]
MQQDPQPIGEELNELAEAVIGAAIAVHRELGPGFHETTYHRAMLIELELRSVAVQSEVPVALRYKNRPIGNGRIDLLVAGRLVVELKAAQANPKKYRRQTLSYLKATQLRLGLVINFEAELLKDGICRVAN